MPHEIVINGLSEGGRATGVARYASEIIRCLGSAAHVIAPARPVSLLPALYWEQVVLPRQLTGDMLLWSPGNSGPLKVQQQAVTIHDLSVFDHPEWVPAALRLWRRFLVPRLLQRARVIFTVSEFTRRSIVRRFSVPDDRVILAPPGVNLQQFRPCDASAVVAKYELADRYVLALASRETRKNLERLLRAWSVRREFKELDLVIVGAGPDTSPNRQSLDNWRRIRFLGSVPDEDLPPLYAGALFFVLPSLFEAFGLSVLEAMACGAPVIASRAGGLPEATGDAALFIDPTSVEGMAEVMRRLVLDPNLRSELRWKGLQRARQFSWERTAQQIMDVLASIS